MTRTIRPTPAFTLLSATVIAALFCFTGVARAQVPPFFAPGATAFTPQISVVNSGIVSDVQAVVSHDRKYVTLNMRQQDSSLLALREFTFQKGDNVPNLGMVGAARGANAARSPASSNAGTAHAPLQPEAAGNSGQAPSSLTILDRTGMIRVDLPRDTASPADEPVAAPKRQK